jgi:2',3'-cyclic-nucleotide 2'-phosphodiesterase/3'-nucleotidase
VYPNTLTALLLSGAQVREWIEMSAGQFRRIDPKGAAQQLLLDAGFRSYDFDTLDGVTYEFDLTQPARYDGNGKLVAPDSHRVQNLRLAGVPVAADAKFIVATNNYRAFGGGNFPGLDGTPSRPPRSRSSRARPTPGTRRSSRKTWSASPPACATTSARPDRAARSRTASRSCAT